MSRFILGDCVRVMATFPGNAVDFILTDPPYLVGFRDRSGRTIAGDKTDEWLQPACNEMYRVLKKDALMVSFYGWNRVDRFMAAWKNAGFSVVGHLVFTKNYTSKAAYLCPQVRVADIVQLNGNIRPRSRQWWQLFRMVSQWHVDVVIVERRSFSIVAAVELDDASHLRPERRRRDILLEEVLRQAGIPLLRSHDARKLLQMTGEWLNTTGADQQSPEHRS
ncbi:TPA: DUF2726 domain-containing protein [Escherichia coli]